MNVTDIAQRLLQKLEASDFSDAEGYLAYDFILVGFAPNPIGKKSFMDMMQAILTGIPDLSFNPGDFVPMNGEATATLHITGAHTKDMPPLFPGMPEIKATGRRIRLPEETATFSVRGNRITQLEIETTSEGGLQGLLEQLGVEIPVGLQIPITGPAVGERL